MLISKDMRPINLQLVWSGCSICYWSTMLTPIIALQLPGKSDTDQLQSALFGLVAFGVGEVIAGFIHGLLIDKIGSRATTFVNMSIILVVIIVTELSLYQLEYNWLSFLMCFLWGLEDGTQNIFLFQMLGYEFGALGDPYAVFTII